MFRKLTVAACRSLLLTALFWNLPALRAQGLSSLLGGPKPAANTTTVTSPVMADPLNRTSPRQAIFNFLQSCHQRNYLKASRYLDLRRMGSNQREKEGPQLAAQLAAVLDHDTQFDLGQLNDTPEGDRDDARGPDLDELETFEVNGQNIVLEMQRVELQPGFKVWLVSSESVARIPELAGLAAASPIEHYLPAPLVNIKFLGTSLWVWLALVLLALLLSALSRVLSKLVLSLVKPLLKRYANTLPTHRLEEFSDPLRLLLSIAVFRVCMETIAASALLRLYIKNVLALLFFLGAASLIMRTVDVISDHLRSRMDARERAVTYSVLPLFVRFIKICLFCIAILLTLEYWGYNTNTILAGVGVGGLAVALAAQKTIENLFGGISVITDRPVLVGDFCQFGGQVGTVEDIGLRSTRIRTLDRTVVTIPNSQFSTMTLENYSKRDRMWFHPTLNLRRDTTPAQIQQVMEAVIQVLKNHPNVDLTAVPLRFTKITPQSFDLDIFAYVLTSNFDDYLQQQSALLLKIIEAVSSAGVSFAVPIQENLVPPMDASTKPFQILLASNGLQNPEAYQPDRNISK